MIFSMYPGEPKMEKFDSSDFVYAPPENKLAETRLRLSAFSFGDMLEDVRVFPVSLCEQSPIEKFEQKLDDMDLNVARLQVKLTARVVGFIDSLLFD